MVKQIRALPDEVIGLEQIILLLPTGQNLFVVDIHDTALFDQIESETDAHVVFLETSFAAGCFIASCSKVPRSGGEIIATAQSRSELEKRLEKDPFKKLQLAKHTLTEFLPSMMTEG